MTSRLPRVGISGTQVQMSWAQCRRSLTPMNARMKDSPYDRCTSLGNAPSSRKYSARRPSRAKASVAKTRYGSPVMP